MSASSDGDATSDVIDEMTSLVDDTTSTHTAMTSPSGNGVDTGSALAGATLADSRASPTQRNPLTSLQDIATRVSPTASVTSRGSSSALSCSPLICVVQAEDETQPRDGLICNSQTQAPVPANNRNATNGINDHNLELQPLSPVALQNETTGAALEQETTFASSPDDVIAQERVPHIYIDKQVTDGIV